MTVLLLSRPTVRWTSRLVGKEEVPTRWGEFRGEDALYLKDTRSAYWPNRLLAPNLFEYVFPDRGHPNRPWEQSLVEDLLARVERNEEDPLRVRLFATNGSRDETYGWWVVRGMERRPARHMCALRLQRLHVQPATEEVDGVASYRSRNEEAHAVLLSRVFPGWLVVHEPETVLDLHKPSVVDGIAQDPVKLSRSYTCDFVLAKGSRRLRVESKPCVEMVTPEAIEKCRVLRDRTLARVLILAGTGADPGGARWLDLGPPRGGGKEEWHEDAASVVKAVLEG